MKWTEETDNLEFAMAKATDLSAQLSGNKLGEMNMKNGTTKWNWKNALTQLK